MEKVLNIPLISQRTNELGLNQTEISEKLGVSKEAVSQWFREVSFPRPSKLLKLGQILNLAYNELVIKENEVEPVVAFRKVKSAKTTDMHFKRAKEMGYSLDKLVKYLPFEIVTKPPELLNPKNEYNYIQNAVKVIRGNLKINKITIDADDIIKCFIKYKTILIPILLGNKKNHENAIHIHLPVSATNWVYINLDTKVFDFKFWLVHELGHIFTPSLTGDEAEDFVDNFAGAFLLPAEIAKQTYYELIGYNDHQSRIPVIFNLAKRHVISPYTILYEVNKFAENNNQKKIDFGSEFHAQNNRFVNRFQLISENLFGENKPDAGEYIKVVEREFETIFFKLLRSYFKEEESSPSFVRSVLNVSVADSKEIYATIINAIHENNP